MLFQQTMLNPSQEMVITTLYTLFKDLFILGAILYIAFAIIVIRQIAIMKKTLFTTFSPVVQLLGFIHLGAALALLLFYLSFL